jgi:Mn-containing catalase
MEGHLQGRSDMYHHIKQLMYTVRIGQPDPHFGNMLLEQFGGANGELAAAMQYSIQGLAKSVNYSASRRCRQYF